MTRILAALTALLLLLAGRWWLMRDSPATTTDTPAAASKPAPAAPAAASAHSDDAARKQQLREGAATRETRRRQITEAIAAREAAAQRRPDVAKNQPAAASPRPAAAKPDEAAAEPAPPLLDRTGNHAYLARVLSEDLLPLVHECEALAREHHPDLAGLLNLNVELLGDEDIGGVIDSLEPAPDNEVVDPGLLECVRESLLSTTLPPPDQGGRDAMMLSLRIGPEPAAPAAPRH